MKKILIFIFIVAAAIVATLISISALTGTSILALPKVDLIFQTITPSDNMQTKEINIGDFDEIETSRVNIEYTIGTPGKAILTAPDNVIGDVVVRNQGGELEVFIDNRSDYRGNTKATLTVSSSSLKDIDASLSAVVNIKSPMVTNNEVDILATTSAKVVIDSIICDEAKLVSKTSASIKTGTISCKRDVSLKASTSATLDVAEITSNEIEAETSTSAHITVAKGKTNIIDLDATTTSTIDMYADYMGGKADASTSGIIKLGADNLTSRATSTHGRIKIR